MAKKSNKKVLYDITTGTKVELPDDDKRSEMVSALLTGTGVMVEHNDAVSQQIESVESEQTDVNKLIDQELEHEYHEHVKYPTSTGLLQCILRELIRQRIGR
jgi:hypothetical protein